MGLFDAVAGVAGGVLGAISGAQGNKSNNDFSSTSTSSVNLQDFNNLSKGQSGLESQTYGAQGDLFSQLSNLVSQGPGASAVSDVQTAGNQYSSLLSQFINNNGLANASQQSAAQDYAKSIFAPQQVALQQSFVDQNQAGARAAAKLGRSGADPVLLAKLGIEQTRQQQSLNAQQGSLAAQTAMDLPQRQLSMAESLFNVKNNLATQAFNNRSALLTLGNQLTASERNYRLQTATRTGSQSGYNNTTSGGGIAGAINGAIAGLGTGFGAAGSLSSAFGGKSSGGVSAGATNNSYATTA
jgi:hypothetical protein